MRHISKTELSSFQETKYFINNICQLYNCNPDNLMETFEKEMDKSRSLFEEYKKLAKKNDELGLKRAPFEYDNYDTWDEYLENL